MKERRSSSTRGSPSKIYTLIPIDAHALFKKTNSNGVADSTQELDLDPSTLGRVTVLY